MKNNISELPKPENLKCEKCGYLKFITMTTTVCPFCNNEKFNEEHRKDVQRRKEL